MLKNKERVMYPSYLVRCSSGKVFDREEWLRRLHRRSGLTTHEVGLMLGVTAARVSQFLTGTIATPSFVTLDRFAAIYGPEVRYAWGVDLPSVVDEVPPVPCEVCGRPIPDRAHLLVRTCSPYCGRVMDALRGTRYWQRRKERMNVDQA